MVRDRIFIIFHALTLMLPVNKQITKMDASLVAAENNDEAAQERLRLAFGPQAMSQIPTIKANIAKINAGNMQVSSKTPGDVEKVRGPINAITPFDYRASEKDPLTTYPVEFGKMFNRDPPKGKNNAATVLHEAAHVFAHASDDHYTTGTKDMVPLGVKLSDDEMKNVKEQGGCTYPFFYLVPISICVSNLRIDAAENPVVKKPIDENSLSPEFKALRDSATNMHMNADSYALFGAVCDEQMARRRKRALMEDDPVRRSSTWGSILTTLFP
jgi:hypothetical protein